MLIEDKTLWLEALRSGKYRQTNGFLKVEREGKLFYCCLGVLCEVLKDKYEIPESMDLTAPGLTKFDGDSMALTTKIARAVGLGNAGIVNSLYRMNDEDKRSFAYIADWIEAHVQVSPEATAETPNT